MVVELEEFEVESSDYIDFCIDLMELDYDYDLVHECESFIDEKFDDESLNSKISDSDCLKYSHNVIFKLNTSNTAGIPFILSHYSQFVDDWERGLNPIVPIDRAICEINLFGKMDALLGFLLEKSDGITTIVDKYDLPKNEYGVFSDLTLHDVFHSYFLNVIKQLKNTYGQTFERKAKTMDYSDFDLFKKQLLAKYKNDSPRIVHELDAKSFCDMPSEYRSISNELK